MALTVWPSPWSGTQCVVWPSAERDLRSLMHINRRGINVTADNTDHHTYGTRFYLISFYLIIVYWQTDMQHGQRQPVLNWNTKIPVIPDLPMLSIQKKLDCARLLLEKVIHVWCKGLACHIARESHIHAQVRWSNQYLEPKENSIRSPK